MSNPTMPVNTSPANTASGGLPPAKPALATVADLIADGQNILWLWPGWLQVGALNAIAAGEGVGKTRLVMDLWRRMDNGLTWPDGQEMTSIPPDKPLALCVLADHNHNEIARGVQEFGIDPHRIKLNATTDDMYHASLGDAEDIALLCQRIKSEWPVMVVIDTITFATDGNICKPEDLRKLTEPLAAACQEANCVGLLLSHVSASGSPYGRRIVGACRVVMKVTQPDDHNDSGRKLWVDKSNALKPPALGVVMGAGGNEYNQEPPQAAAQNQPSPKLKQAMEWLKGQLTAAPCRLTILRDAAEDVGISAKTLYAARDQLSIVAYEDPGDGFTYWKLPPD